MKLKVDESKCFGCGMCVSMAPENFDFNKEGLSTVIGEEITDNTRNVAAACPAFAISIEEDNSTSNPCECQKKDGNCECDHKSIEDSTNKDLKEAA